MSTPDIPELARAIADEIRDGGLLCAPEYLNTQDAAKLIGLSPAILEKWRTDGRNLRYSKVGTAVRYKRSDLIDFMESQAMGGGA